MNVKYEHSPNNIISINKLKVKRTLFFINVKCERRPHNIIVLHLFKLTETYLSKYPG